jgi:hypothetical protein
MGMERSYGTSNTYGHKYGENLSEDKGGNRRIIIKYEYHGRRPALKADSLTAMCDLII